jgi:hypothetical protein
MFNFAPFHLSFDTKTSFMEPTGTQDATLQVSTTPRGMFGGNIPSAAAFLAGILLFLLPFAEVRCNGTALANNTGLGIAMGSEWKELVTKNVLGVSHGTETPEKREYTKSQDPNVFAIIALALGITGILLAVLAVAHKSNINFYIGLLAAASLVAMLIDLRSKAKSDTSLNSSDGDLNVTMKITVDGTAAYYIAVILFIIAAVLSLQRRSHSQGTKNQEAKISN